MQERPTGWLALVATPIGNLEDITFRAARVLGEADLVAAEDTRRAGRLLQHLRIRPRLTAYHAHNEHARTEALLEQVLAGTRLAVLSDAGTPAISDPGFLIVRAALARGVQPEIVPGVSALTCAAVACGLPVHQFTFGGFLPPKGAKRRKELRRLAAGGQTLFLFESPHRMGRLLADVVAELGEESRVALLRELTKQHEEHLHGTAGELLAAHGDRKWRGELTVAIQAAVPPALSP